MRPRAVEVELWPDLLDDDDALNETVLAFLAAHARTESSTRRLAGVELDGVCRQLDPHGREVLGHALGLLDRALEEAAVALATEILQRFRRCRAPLTDRHVLCDPQRLGEALEGVVRHDAEVRRLGALVRLAERRVRPHVPDAAWLRWEEALVARAAAADLAIVRWAFDAGRQAAGAEETPQAHDEQAEVLHRPARGEAT